MRGICELPKQAKGCRMHVEKLCECCSPQLATKANAVRSFTKGFQQHFHHFYNITEQVIDIEHKLRV